MGGRDWGGGGGGRSGVVSVNEQHRSACVCVFVCM